MRVVLFVLSLVAVNTASAQTYEQLNFTGDHTFGLRPFASEQALFGNEQHHTPAAESETLGSNLAEVFGVAKSSPAPGTCRLSVIPQFRLTCVPKR